MLSSLLQIFRSLYITVATGASGPFYPATALKTSKVSMWDLISSSLSSTQNDSTFEDEFSKHAKCLHLCILDILLQDPLLQFPYHFVMAKGTGESLEKEGVGVFSTRLAYCFSLCLITVPKYFCRSLGNCLGHQEVQS